MRYQRTITIPKNQELKIIYSDYAVSEEVKSSFLAAYSDLEHAYNLLKVNLDKYLVQKAHNSDNAN